MSREFEDCGEVEGWDNLSTQISIDAALRRFGSLRSGMEGLDDI
jgi:hypothetical protein